MIPYETHKILFTITDKFALFTWALIFVIAWLLGGYFVYREAKKREDINPDTAMQFLLATLLGVMFGSRLFHFFGPWGYGTFYERIKNMFSPVGGWVAYGGIIFALIFEYIYSRAKKINYLKYCDLLAPGIPLGIVVGRFGCFLTGCCFGSPTNVPWAIVRNNIAIHPTQLYHAFANLVVFIIMLELCRRHKARRGYDGYLIFSTLVLYSIGRFIVEFFRDYGPDVFHFGLTFSQIIAIMTVVVLGSIIILKHKKTKTVPAINNKTRFSYMLVGSGGIISIISALFININFYLLLVPLIFGGLILFYGLVVYTKT